MELEKLKNLIINYAKESGYFINDYSDLISFKVNNNPLEISETIFAEIIPNSTHDIILKNTIVFSGIGFPFNPLLESEKLKAISLLRGNTTMRTNGYWGIEYSSGTYWLNYFVDVYEEGLNSETFKVTISSILSAKQNLENLIEKPFHVN